MHEYSHSINTVFFNMYMNNMQIKSKYPNHNTH